MTSGWNKQGCYIECDGKSCHAFIESEDRNIGDLWNRAEAERWKSRKINGDWLHFCPDCDIPNSRPDIAKILKGI